jgi:hypothetical protein
MHNLIYTRKTLIQHGFLWMIVLGLFSCSHPQKHYDTAITRYRILFEDNIVGHITLEQQTQPTLHRTVETLELRTQFRGMSAIVNSVTEIHEEDLQGRALHFSKHINIPHAERSIFGDIHGSQLMLRDKRGDQEQHLQITIPDNFLLHEGLRQQLHAAAQTTQSLAYMEWNYDEQKFVPVQVQLISDNSIAAWRFIQRREKNSERPTLESKPSGAPKKLVREQMVDQEFLPVQARFDYFGKHLLLERCADQCRNDTVVSLKPLDQQMLDSPYKITDSALSGRIRYTIKMAAGRAPQTTSEQRVRATESGWVVDVCAHCELKQNSENPELSHYLTANTWLEATDSRLVAAVAKAVQKDDSPTIKMKKLAVLTRKRLEPNPQFSGYATALQAYQSRSGDCTEYAVLLAALGRAAQVPARVVFGLSYSREKFHGKTNAFAPHAWVQAWVDGAWRSYDAAFDHFDAGHIALQVSDGNQEDFNEIFENFNEMKIETMQQIIKPMIEAE